MFILGAPSDRPGKALANLEALLETGEVHDYKSSVPSFVLRALLPIVILGAALLGLTRIAGDGDPTGRATLLARIVVGAILSGAAIVMVIVLGRWAAVQTVLDNGVGRWRDAWRPFAIGVILWLVPATVAVVGLLAFGAPLTVNATAAETLAVVMLVLGAVLLSEAIPEELIFRGHLMSVLGERLQGWWNILVQAVLFTGFALMLRGWTGVADFSLFLGMGIGLGYLRLVSGSVWIAVGFHAAFQTGSQLILTHDVVALSGSQAIAMIAFGAFPFAVGAILVALLAPKYSYLLARQR